MMAALARTPISVWGLLVWAYHPHGQHVRATSGTDNGRSVLREMSATGKVLEAMSMGGVFRGTPGNGSYARAFCHEDALIIHKWVRELPGDAEWRMIKAAEAGALPEWHPSVPTVDQMLPVVNERTGEVVVHKIYCSITKRSGRRYCPLRWMPPEARNESDKKAILLKARESYAEFIADLDLLHRQLNIEQPSLTRWRITGIGVERSPWVEGVKIVA